MRSAHTGGKIAGKLGLARSAQSLRIHSCERELGYVEKTSVEQLELRNYCKREERQRHKRLLLPVDAHRICALYERLAVALEAFRIARGHKSRDVEGERIDLAVLLVGNDHSAAYPRKLVCRLCHTLVVVAEQNYVVRIVRNGYTHSAAPEAVTFQQPLADVASVLMALHHRHLEDVRADYVDVAVLRGNLHNLAAGDHVAGENGHNPCPLAL